MFFDTGWNYEVVTYSITSIGYGADPGFLAVSLHVTLVINPVVGCRYFPVFTRSAVTFPVLLAGTQLHCLVSGDRGTQV